jgi:hypothetical protein
MAGMGKLAQEMAQAGVLLSTDGLLPSRNAMKLRHAGGRTSVIDGPFAEAKEVIGGYAIVRAATRTRRSRWRSASSTCTSPRACRVRDGDPPDLRCTRRLRAVRPRQETTMRFMMLMIPKGYESAPPGATPPADAVAAMMKYNESLRKAGVLIALDGLHPPSMGARVSFEGGKPKVTDGPFAEAKEVLGGYWMIQVRSRDEAIAWASRCPASGNEVIEIRQVQELEDFPPDVQKAAAGLKSMQPHPSAR